MSHLLEARGLIVELPTPAGWVRPVNEVSVRINAGQSLGLVGESGSGKTMLSLALMGLLPPGARLGGEATLALESSAAKLTSLSERDWRSVRGGQIAMIFQKPMTSLNPVLRIGAQIEEAIRAHHSQLHSAERKRKAIDALRLAAVPEPEVRAEQFPHQLSGGLRKSIDGLAFAFGGMELRMMSPNGFFDLRADAQDRIQRSHGLLKNHGDLAAADAAPVALAQAG